MEQFFIYMVKASGLIAVFFIAYYVFLKKETFFVSNRWFLLAGIVTSLLLPIIVFTKIVWIDPQPIQEVHVIDVSQLLLMQQDTSIADATVALSWPNIVLGIYIAGVLFLTLKLIITFISLRRILKDVKAIKQDGFSFIDTQKIQAPFSFFNYIVYNSAILLPHELESILCHEKVHSVQKHSADMLLSQLLTIFFWFNPFAWLYKKSISQNLEFIADAYAAKQISDTTAYQKTMLKITLQPEYITITNHFYQSLIKKRIVMLNKKQSGKLNSWKYALVLPALTAFIYLFQIKVVAQERDNSKAVEEVSQEKFKMAFEINKNSNEKDFEKIKELSQKEFNATVTFSDVTRNSDSEITGIKVTINNGSEPKIFQTKGTNAINPFRIEMEKTDNNASTVAFAALPVSNEYKMYADNMEYFEDGEDPIAPPAPIVPMAPRSSVAPPAPPAPPTLGFMQPGMQNGLHIINSANNDILVIINGKKQQKGAAVTIPNGQTIVSLNILSSKDAKKKYGKEAKEGALEITTQEGGQLTFTSSPIIFDLNAMKDFEFNMENMIDPQVFAEVNARVAEEMQRNAENLQWISEDRMQQDLQRGLENIKRGEDQIQRDQQRMEERKIRFERRVEERQERNTDRAKERDEARKQMEEMRKEMEEARKEIMESRKEIEKELKKIRSEKE
ncbi:M56 family metallopeptidase [Flavobacterium beibuense]|uniref:Antirepressor regulating drug resistance protein n=1 Tax=Flavobacterium beibuense TaxID=657326 RepID=A0A444WAM3_9FLAO|nr:M56 family metallopeptidase [Flavobacterium beibuense]RYJ42858.1 Antirepressor regulating drug resistance protein [Flavobacterium beibuense]